MKADDFKVQECILKNVKNFFQGKIVSDSWFKVKSKVLNERLSQAVDADKIERYEQLQMMNTLARMIYQKKSDVITTEVTDQFINFNCEVIVLTGKEVKHLVEYCIRHIEPKRLIAIHEGYADLKENKDE